VAQAGCSAGAPAGLERTPPPTRPRLAGCSDWSTAALATSRAAGFIDTTGRRLFRRQLDAGEHARFLAKSQAWASAIDFCGATQLTLSAMLQSPQFL
jgi:hypothetical protein